MTCLIRMHVVGAHVPKPGCLERLEQIDHVVMSKFGIFVIEAKNIDGWIFGDEKSAKWTVVKPGRKHQMQNPLRQNLRHTKAIAEFLNQQVSFSYDTRINQIVVKVTKGDTEEVIRQIPSEEMIELITRFRKDFRGLIFNRTG